jgi:Leucine-rich repeat (LRR) protein
MYNGELVMNPGGVTVDLTACTKLTYIYTYRLNVKWIVPNGVSTNPNVIPELALKWHNGFPIPDLTSATSLKTINVSSSTIVKTEKTAFLAEIAKCINLNTLDMSDNAGLTDLAGIEVLSTCTNLKKINVYCLPERIGDRDNLTSITGIGAITSLEELYCYNQKITDISDLTTLTNLKTLSIYHNRIADISALANLTNLTTLIINDNSITDLSALKNLKNLTSLNLKNNSIYNTYGNVNNLQILADLIDDGKLKTLYLSGNNIDDYGILNAKKSKLTNYDW